MCDQTDGYFTRLTESYEEKLFVDGLADREQTAMRNHGDCTCAAAPTCPVFRRPGELFEDGLPDGFDLHHERR